MILPYIFEFIDLTVNCEPGTLNREDKKCQSLFKNLSGFLNQFLGFSNRPFWRKFVYFLNSVNSKYTQWKKSSTRKIGDKYKNFVLSALFPA